MVRQVMERYFELKAKDEMLDAKVAAALDPARDDFPLAH
jgi:hypothetical protein